MNTWFKTASYATSKIEAVNVVKETDKTVTVVYEHKQWGSQAVRKTERRHTKESGFERFFPTWEAAHAFLLEKAESNLVSARRSLERAQGEYGNVKGMKKPEAA